MIRGDTWCPENDGAYRAELSAIHQGQETRLREEIAALRRTIDLIASGQVDAVALARAEKRRWGK